MTAAKTKRAKAAPVLVPPVPVAPRKWYVLCCESGKEQRVRADLLRAAKVADLFPHYYKACLVPVTREEVPREGDGKLIMVRSVKYEGYVFLNMVYCPLTAGLVRECRHQFGLLPHRPMRPSMPPNKAASANQQAEFDRWVKWQPVGLESREAASMLLEEQATFKKKLPPPPKFAAGDQVAIIDRSSPFFKMTGPVSVGADGRLSVTMSILGTPLTVAFETWQMKAND